VSIPTFIWYHLTFSFFTIIMIVVSCLIIRARMYGWPNTYVFTKAMGEMIVGTTKGNMNVVILRPTIITSTYREPFPGWIEGLRYLIKWNTCIWFQLRSFLLSKKEVWRNETLHSSQNFITWWGVFDRTIDSLVVAYGKGKLTCFLADLKAVFDVVSQ